MNTEKKKRSEFTRKQYEEFIDEAFDKIAQLTDEKTELEKDCQQWRERLNLEQSRRVELEELIRTIKIDLLNTLNPGDAIKRLYPTYAWSLQELATAIEHKVRGLENAIQQANKHKDYFYKLLQAKKQIPLFNLEKYTFQKD